MNQLLLDFFICHFKFVLELLIRKRNQISQEHEYLVLFSYVFGLLQIFVIYIHYTLDQQIIVVVVLVVGAKSKIPPDQLAIIQCLLHSNHPTLQLLLVIMWYFIIAVFVNELFEQLFLLPFGALDGTRIFLFGVVVILVLHVVNGQVVWVLFLDVHHDLNPPILNFYIQILQIFRITVYGHR